MKVFTHWIDLNQDDCTSQKKEGIRWRTLLQFGNSWNIIGSVVMKNPGASIFKGNKNTVNLAELNQFDSEQYEWYEFTSDATMHKIEDLFSFYYGKKLEGVIQIFNLFYIREADLGKGMKLDSEASLPKCLVSGDEMLKNDLEHLKETPKSCPIYLGFSSLASDAKYGVRAKAFFDVTIKHYEENSCYLNPEYRENPFYHPLYLMGYGRNRSWCINQLYSFKQNSLTPEIPNDYKLTTVSHSSKQFAFEVEEGVKKYIKDCDNKEQCRYFLRGDDIFFTVTHGSGNKGEISVNFDDRNAKENIPVRFESLRKLIQDEYHFNEPEKENLKHFRLGYKTFKDYDGKTAEEKANAIASEINNIIDRLKTR